MRGIISSPSRWRAEPDEKRRKLNTHLPLALFYSFHSYSYFHVTRYHSHPCFISHLPFLPLSAPPNGSLVIIFVIGITFPLLLPSVECVRCNERFRDCGDLTGRRIFRTRRVSAIDEIAATIAANRCVHRILSRNPSKHIARRAP